MSDAHQHPWQAWVSPLVFIKKNFFLKKLSIKPLSFQMQPLPLHSKLKNESLKFFTYVTKNKDKIAVLRP
jgi:hypothetical protein